MTVSRTLPGSHDGEPEEKTLTAPDIIEDYLATCEKRGEILDGSASADLRTVANAIAGHGCREGERPSDVIDRIFGKDASEQIDH
jgi:hypothetical protein